MATAQRARGEERPGMRGGEKGEVGDDGCRGLGYLGRLGQVYGGLAACLCRAGEGRAGRAIGPKGRLQPDLGIGVFSVCLS